MDVYRFIWHLKVMRFSTLLMLSASTFCLCRKGQQLEPSEKYIFNRLEGGRSMLTVRNIRQIDGGSYSCKATNKAGSQERELFLNVFGKKVYFYWSIILMVIEFHFYHHIEVVGEISHILHWLYNLFCPIKIKPTLKIYCFFIFHYLVAVPNFHL